MTREWSPQQERALDRVGRWLRAKDKPYFQLAGYAGTGKTTLARHLAESVEGRVHFAAYTGKAASILIKNGCTNVSTIHKLIYKPKDKSQQRLKDLEAERAGLMTVDPLPKVLIEKVERAIEEEKRNLARPMFSLNLEESPLKGAALLVVDEFSMIDRAMGEDLLAFNVPILALGDPGQLPPVGGSSFFPADRSDLVLTEIHRQARDNPIIRLSTDVREGRPLRPGQYGSSCVARYEDLDRTDLADMVLTTDQLLVGRNETRRSSNARVRQLMRRETPYPEVGDKLVCLRNNHDAGLLNGQMWRSRGPTMDVDEKVVSLELENEDAQKLSCLAHNAYFHGTTPAPWEIKDADGFDYGYALTVHKSQGSQWNNVLLFDEWYGQNRREWLYTAITRAAERIDVVQM